MKDSTFQYTSAYIISPTLFAHFPVPIQQSLQQLLQKNKKANRILGIFNHETYNFRFVPVTGGNIIRITVRTTSLLPDTISKILVELTFWVKEMLYQTGVRLFEENCAWQGYLSTNKENIQRDTKDFQSELIEQLMEDPNVIEVIFETVDQNHIQET